MDDSPISRRRLLALSGAAALHAACAQSIPAPARCLANPPQLFPPAQPGPADPLPGFTAERLSVRGYDEIHGMDADVHRPRSLEELQRMVAKAAEIGRKITVRGGGMSLGEQSLGKTILLMDQPWLQHIGEVRRQGPDLVLTCGAGARWGDVVRRISEQGYVPRSVVTTGDATVGGTAAVDGVARMSPLVGKEGEQITGLEMIDGTGARRAYADPSAPEFRAAIAGFGAVGVLTEVTFKVARAIPGCRARPDVETQATRYMPGTYDWADLLRSIASDSRNLAARYQDYYARGVTDAGVECTLPARSAVIGLSLVGWFAGEGLAIDRLEHRYVRGEPGLRIPGGLYAEDSGFARFGDKVSAWSPTLSEMISSVGFPNGSYVDELCGFLFFMGNSATPAIQSMRSQGSRLNFTQQTYVLPAPRRPSGAQDVAQVTQFVSLVFARCREREIRPFSVDFLALPADHAFLSATRDLEGFCVNLTFADQDAAEWLWIREALMALSNDALELGGRVHLVKNVEADPADLRAMYRDGFRELKAVKDRLDPRGVLTSAFYDRYFAGWKPS